MHYNPAVEPELGPLCFTAKETNSTVQLVKNETPLSNDFEISIDGKNWDLYTWDNNNGATITLVNVGDKVYFRNTSEVTKKLSTSTDNYYQFKMTGKISASGDITSLLNMNGNVDTIPSKCCFASLFENCTSLTTAPKLHVTNLSEGCYFYMFYGCTSLTAAPELPATILHSQCYQSMFYGCTSLTEAPELPATTLVKGCYADMFDNCTSLITAPELPATILHSQCYQSMFYGCTSLTQAPELPAAILKDWCYCDMFSQCTSLSTAPESLGTTLDIGCCSGMFYGCTSLTQAPELPATTLVTSCYQSMFMNCSSLNSITCYATNLQSMYNEPPYTGTYQWVKGVPSNGTFIGYNNSIWYNSESGIPDNWNYNNVEIQTPTSTIREGFWPEPPMPPEADEDDPE